MESLTKPAMVFRASEVKESLVREGSIFFTDFKCEAASSLRAKVASCRDTLSRVKSVLIDLSLSWQ